jgi:TolA-binding protein
MPATEVPKQVGPYEILAPLGKGGVAGVYKAMEPSSNRTVAIKLLPAAVANDPAVVERFHREAQAVAMLQHAGIVQLLDRGEDRGILYLVMELVEGTSLDVVLRQRRLSLQEAVQVVKQLARALEVAHAAGIVHRDLNPRNILVSPNLSVVKLGGFGIGRVESVMRKLGTLTTKEMTLGSLSYLAPEQAADASAVDHRADIYALGVVFYEALTGRIPLGRFNLPSELNRELPSEIDPIVLKCLATEPGKRYATVSQLLAQIETFEEKMRFELLGELEGLKRGTSKLLGPSGFLGKRGVMVLFVLLAVALAGIGGWMLLNPVAPAPVEKEAPADPEKATASPAPGDAPATSVSGGSAAAPPASPPEVPVAAVSAPAGKVVEKRPTEAKPATDKPAAVPAKPPSEGGSKPAKPGVDPAAADLEVARGKFDARLFDQALADARALVGKYPASPVSIDGYYLIARSLASLQRREEAIGAYVEIQSRFKGDPRAAEAAFQQAKLVQAADSKKTTEEAKRLYADCAAAYPTSSWSARALAAKAEIEREQRATVKDAALGATVPSALATYRDLTARFPADPVAEKAWWELGQMYEDEKRWDLAAQAYEELAVRFPQTRLDAWFQAAEIYDRRLKDAARAKQAYGKVPTTSSHFKEAQRKAGG